MAVKDDRHGFLLNWQAFIWSISTYDQILYFVAPESGKLWVNVGVVAFIGDNNEYSEWAIFFPPYSGAVSTATLSKASGENVHFPRYCCERVRAIEI